MLAGYWEKLVQPLQTLRRCGYCDFSGLEVVENVLVENGQTPSGGSKVTRVVGCLPCLLRTQLATLSFAIKALY